jgi:hypothetical protein
MELQDATPGEEVQATAQMKDPLAPLRGNIRCFGGDGAAGRVAPPYASSPHLTPPQLLTAGEGQTEGGGEGRQEVQRAKLVREKVEEEGGRRHRPKEEEGRPRWRICDPEVRRSIDRREGASGGGGADWIGVGFRGGGGASNK